MAKSSPANTQCLEALTAGNDDIYQQFQHEFLHAGCMFSARVPFNPIESVVIGPLLFLALPQVLVKLF
jgi:hypothetical protein